MTNAKLDALTAFKQWYANLKIYKANNNTPALPARGTIGAALLILEQLKTSYVLDLNHFRAAGGSQLKKISGKAVQKIMGLRGFVWVRMTGFDLSTHHASTAPDGPEEVCWTRSF